MKEDRETPETSPVRGTLASLAGELLRLAATDPVELSRRVAELTIREQAELALRLPATSRLELLLHAPKPLKLVRALPDSELYLTVRELGPADGMPLISLASASQLHHLIDLESWRKDRFDADRAGAWIALFLESGDPPARRWLLSADDELLALIALRWMGITQIEYEDGAETGGHGEGEAGTPEGYLTPDGYHRFSPSIPEHAPAIRRFLKLFFDEQPERYTQVIWSSRWELPSDLEEQALQWRQARMEEHGFPGWDDALSVYAAPEGLKERPAPLNPIAEDGLAASRFPLRRLDRGSRLIGAIERMPDGIRERMLHELISLANHVLIADGADPGDPVAHAGALDKVGAYLQVALDARSLDDSSSATVLMQEAPLIELFREGYSRIVALQSRTNALIADGWPGGNRRALEMLDSPVRERVEGLLRPRPLFFELPHDGDPGRFREIQSPDELDALAVALEVAEVIGQVLVERFGLDVTTRLHEYENQRRPVPTLGTWFRTALAWSAARETLRIDPLPPDVAADFLRNVASRKTAAPDAPDRALEGLVRRLADGGGLSPRRLSVVQSFGRFSLEQLTEECAALDPGVPPDSGAIRCLLLS